MSINRSANNEAPNDSAIGVCDLAAGHTDDVVGLAALPCGTMPAPSALHAASLPNAATGSPLATSSDLDDEIPNSTLVQPTMELRRSTRVIKKPVRLDL